MTIYAVIDTNVLVSSMLTKNRKAATARLVDALIGNKFRPVYNNDIIEEYAEVLARTEFSFDTDLVEGIINLIRTNGLFAERTPTNDPVIDPKDVAFYEVALSKNGAYLVTGNLKHFPQKPIVVTPAEMVRILEDNCLIGKDEQ